MDFNILQAANSQPFTLEKNSAWFGHIPFAVWLTATFKPKRIVELGTHWGHSYFAFCQAVKQNQLFTECYAVDTWQGDTHAGVYNDEVFQLVEKYNQDNFSSFSTLLRKTFDQAAEYFSDATIDLLHIDGLHTYEAVKHDFLTWLPKLSPRAIVLFHDINVREHDFGVWKLWDELTQQYPNNYAFSHSAGLGVLQLNSSAAALFHPTESAQQYRELFANFGQHLQDKYLKIEIENNLQVANSRLVDYHLLVVDREQNISKLQEEIKQRDARLTDYQILVTDREQNISKLQEEINLRDTHLSDYQILVTDREQNIIHLKKIMNELQQQIEQNQIESCRLLQQNNILQSEIDVHQARLVDYHHLVMDRDQHIASMYASNSWKITRPLRLPKSFKNKVVKLAKTINTMMSNSGGISGAITRAKIIWRQEGFHGLTRRVSAKYNPQPLLSIQAEQATLERNYPNWVQLYDTLTEADKTILQNKLKTLKHLPLISVVMPTYNANIPWLEEAIISVQQQIYPNWQLCIADDASTKPEVRECLARFAANDQRIKLVFCPENGHISAASNSALELATGEWIALLDHDDLLSEHALLWVAVKINEHPQAQLIYSDEDKINENYQRFSPYFKCDWNYDLFLSHNLITHLGVYRHDIIKKIGGFRLGYEGAQDYDLALRFIAEIDQQNIIHIPKILYHWRAHPASTAETNDSKPYAMLAGERALNEFLSKRQVNAHAELIGHGFRVHYRLPANKPLVSIIIPTRNGYSLLKQCIDSLLSKTSYQNYEIIIIDNNSDDQVALTYFAELSDHPKINIRRDEQAFNYSALNNAAVNEARGDYICLMNNDIEIISPEWLSEMLSIACQDGVGAVGAKLYYPNNTVQHAGVIVGLGGVAGHSHKHAERTAPGYSWRLNLLQSLSAVTAACLVIKKSTFLAVGGLNAEQLKIAFNDVDFCLKVRDLGYRNVWTPFAEFYHHESATRGYEVTQEQINRFESEKSYMIKTWPDIITHDPAYSPNLTTDHEDFSYAWPPRKGGCGDVVN